MLTDGLAGGERVQRLLHIHDALVLEGVRLEDRDGLRGFDARAA